MHNFIKTDHRDNILELHLSVLVFQEGDFFIAYCPTLDLSSYGRSIQDAKEAFDESMAAYIEEAKRMGTLTKDLTAHGWTFTDHSVTPPSGVELDIPAGMLKKQFTERWPVATC